MKSFAAPILLTLFILLTSHSCLLAQEENEAVVTQGSRYLDLKIKSLNKYDSRIERQQDRLLKKLKKKEKRFSHKLRDNDSLAYNNYKKRPLTFDSISKIVQNDTGKLVRNSAMKDNASITKLKGVESFVESKSATPTPEMQDRNAELATLQNKANKRDLTNNLIAKHTDELKSFCTSTPGAPGLKGIQKQVFYGRARMKAFKEIEEEPSKAEDVAMECLQGSKGFNKYLNKGGAGSAPEMTMPGTDASKLEGLGYQTKQLLQGSLQNKLGGDMGTVAKQMGGDISKWQGKQNELVSNAKQTKQSLAQLKKAGKPAFKVNAMRGLPFWKRIEKQYSFNTALPDGTKPAIVEPAVMAGFKHTPKLTYGLGVACSIGVGQGWQKIHFSYEGISFRSFTTWEWQYGISAYAGYERTYDNFLSIKKPQDKESVNYVTPHKTAAYSESILVGLSKKYKINDKYTGAIQVLYDIWWQQKGLNNPIILRFTTTKK